MATRFRICTCISTLARAAIRTRAGRSTIVSGSLAQLRISTGSAAWSRPSPLELRQGNGDRLLIRRADGRKTWPGSRRACSRRRFPPLPSARGQREAIPGPIHFDVVPVLCVRALGIDLVDTHEVRSGCPRVVPVELGIVEAGFDRSPFGWSMRPSRGSSLWSAYCVSGATPRFRASLARRRDTDISSSS